MISRREKEMSKENVILIDYDAPDDWEFHKAIEKQQGQNGLYIRR